MDFLKYWLDTHPIMFGIVIVLLTMGVSSTLGNLFKVKGKNDRRADGEHEKRF